MYWGLRNKEIWIVVNDFRGLRIGVHQAHEKRQVTLAYDFSS